MSTALLIITSARSNYAKITSIKPTSFFRFVHISLNSSLRPPVLHRGLHNYFQFFKVLFCWLSKKQLNMNMFIFITQRQRFYGISIRSCVILPLSHYLNCRRLLRITFL